MFYSGDNWEQRNEKLEDSLLECYNSMFNTSLGYFDDEAEHYEEFIQTEEYKEYEKNRKEHDRILEELNDLVDDDFLNGYTLISGDEEDEFIEIIKNMYGLNWKDFERIVVIDWGQTVADYLEGADFIMIDGITYYYV